MRRFACFAIAALACTSAAAQNYSGTFTTTNQQGGTVTLVLKQDASSNVKGTLTGNDNTFQVAAQATPQGLMGTVSGQQGNLYLMAQYEGASLVVILAEPGPNGQANLQSARRLVFAKAGAAPAAKKAPSPKPAAGGMDGQLTQLLTRNAWCGFTYNQRSGTSTRERVANQARWKVAEGMLHLSPDGMSWTPQQLQVTQNSNGYPIIKSGGKEYMQCN